MKPWRPKPLRWSICSFPLMALALSCSRTPHVSPPDSVYMATEATTHGPAFYSPHLHARTDEIHHQLRIPPVSEPPQLESVDDYGGRAETFDGESGEIRMLSPDDPMLVRANIRGVDWPLARNEGTSQVYPPQEGQASYYWQPQKTATGEHFNPEAMTAAHKKLPFGTVVRVTRLDTGAAVLVVINDRGPYIKGRIIDLSKAAARKLDMLTDGVVPCRLDVVAYPLIDVMGPRGNG